MIELIFSDGENIIKIRILEKNVLFSHAFMNDNFMDIRKLPVPESGREKFKNLLENISKADSEHETANLLVLDFQNDGYKLIKNG